MYQEQQQCSGTCKTQKYTENVVIILEIYLKAKRDINILGYLCMVHALAFDDKTVLERIFELEYFTIKSWLYVCTILFKSTHTAFQQQRSQQEHIVVSWKREFLSQSVCVCVLLWWSWSRGSKEKHREHRVSCYSAFARIDFA